MSKHDDVAADSTSMELTTPVDSETEVKRHNVFDNPDLLVRLLLGDTDLGYKLSTYYTASMTLYIALVGVMAQQYFAAARQDTAKSSTIALFGFAFSLLSLTAPFGLNACRREIESRAATYAIALSLPPERFLVIRFGTWLSLCAFVAISAGWAYLLFVAK